MSPSKRDFEDQVLGQAFSRMLKDARTDRVHGIGLLGSRAEGYAHADSPPIIADPPPALMDLIADASRTIRPASRLERSTKGFIDQETGQKADLLLVHIEWVTASEVIVEHVYDAGVRSASAWACHARLAESGWKVEKQRSIWES